MPQAGRLYPRSAFQDIRRSDPAVWTSAARTNYPPRKIRINLPSYPVGLLYEKWWGLTPVSEVGERTDDAIMYRTNHPTEAGCFWKTFIKTKRGPDLMPPQYVTFMQCMVEFYDDDSLWGASNWSSWGGSWGTTSSYNNVWYFATDYIRDPVQFVRPGDNRGMAWATWEENEPYQPYVTRP